ncbi:MAG: magnesium transporter [Gemmataceae bacterium]
MIGPLIRPDLHELIAEKQWDVLREVLSEFDPSDIGEILREVADEDTVALFRLLPRDLAGAVFAYLPLDMQESLLHRFSNEQAHQVIDGMTPDDQARLFDELPAEITRRLLELLDPEELRVARSLLGYPPESAGRYMTPRYLALHPSMTARDALDFVRRSGHGMETLSILYVVDEQGKLLAELRLGTLVLADPEAKIGDLEDRPLVWIPASAGREEVLRAFKKYDRVALPVCDQQGIMLGIITGDDVLDVAEEEATEDIQKFGGMEALDAPYLDVSFTQMVWKRGGWLSVLFLGEMLTATAMGHFEDEISKAIVLSLFIPLIISSGGNSGSQASTLIVRSLALTELTLRDWWRVFFHELRAGVTLGTWLGFIGFVRIVTWQALGWADYSSHYLLVALTVWASLIGVVTFGSLSGSMLPFILRRLGFDPATSSAPFVATLVDVTGLIIYFTAAMLILGGTLL